MIPEDTIGLPGADCIPEKYKIKVEKETECKGIEKIEEKVSEIKEDITELKKDMRKVKEDVEMTKDTVFDIWEILRRKK
jgi:archaellum component FlaC